uniref:Uncharacterized protein n=1 Tax=Arundo donax TaxID=35708 RepID=A0A0A9F2B3_ARUDO
MSPPANSSDKLFTTISRVFFAPYLWRTSTIFEILVNASTIVSFNVSFGRSSIIISPSVAVDTLR